MSNPPPDFPVALAREVFARLCGSLPPPVVDTPEARAVRDDLAYAAVEALYPVDAAEALLAVQVVTTDARALACLRLADMPGRTEVEAHRNRAQALAMMRISHTALRALERRQAARQKAEDAAWQVAAPAPAPEPAEEPEQSGIEAEADQYAIIYPQRAARIRACGGLPQPCDFGPPRDALVRVIANGDSPILRALDAEAERSRVTLQEILPQAAD
jgi:hypothetical protein